MPDTSLSILVNQETEVGIFLSFAVEHLGILDVEHLSLLDERVLDARAFVIAFDPITALLTSLITSVSLFLVRATEDVVGSLVNIRLLAMRLLLMMCGCNDVLQMSSGWRRKRINAA